MLDPPGMDAPWIDTIVVASVETEAVGGSMGTAYVIGAIGAGVAGAITAAALVDRVGSQRSAFCFGKQALCQLSYCRSGDAEFERRGGIGGNALAVRCDLHGRWRDVVVYFRLSAAGVSHAGLPKGAVTGRAVDASGKPAAGLDIELVPDIPRVHTGEIGWSTGADGSFELGDIAATREPAKELRWEQHEWR